jgi:hypothetical protein
VAQPWTRTDRLTYWTLVVAVGGGLLAMSTQVPKPWDEVCRVVGIVLVVVCIPCGMLLPLLARKRGERQGDGEGQGGEQPHRAVVDTMVEQQQPVAPPPQPDIEKLLEEAREANRRRANMMDGKQAGGSGPPGGQASR